MTWRGTITVPPGFDACYYAILSILQSRCCLLLAAGCCLWATFHHPAFPLISTFLLLLHSRVRAFCAHSNKKAHGTGDPVLRCAIGIRRRRAVLIFSRLAYCLCYCYLDARSSAANETKNKSIYSAARTVMVTTLLLATPGGQFDGHRTGTALFYSSSDCVAQGASQSICFYFYISWKAHIPACTGFRGAQKRTAIAARQDEQNKRLGRKRGTPRSPSAPIQIGACLLTSATCKQLAPFACLLAAALSQKQKKATDWRKQISRPLDISKNSLCAALALGEKFGFRILRAGINPACDLNTTPSAQHRS